jgi:predicted nucleic acid-binding protein
MPASVYIESSVISYLTARPSRDVVVASRQTITSEWWTDHMVRYEVYISALVIEEISAGNPIAAAARLQAVANIPSVTIDPDAELLAEALLAAGAVPANSTRDALHIAIATLQGADFLLTWNFKHINNAETRGIIAKVIADHGWACPVLCSPEELVGKSDAG